MYYYLQNLLYILLLGKTPSKQKCCPFKKIVTVLIEEIT